MYIIIIETIILGLLFTIMVYKMSRNPIKELYNYPPKIQERVKSLEQYKVVGNPARPIRKRFDEELIDIMEKLKWWDKSIEEINNLIPLLTSSDLEKVKQELLKLV